ncbi:universal stress protein [Jatrophihabitans telluris]|uniref:Universal stress protein n=1 Tax=Jatrophihabitans telluris TaxID=2038343 RepID=A0ABY4R1Y8_9ACTN|nr:universal stress protein [Jatrophihabitans telluris]UQX89537.1 universal stress protein [Jatrophihabitans telluris]
MTILVSYVPSAEGFAAMNAAVQAAKLAGTSILVLNVAVGTNFADPTFADERDLDAVRQRLHDEGVPSEIRQVTDARDVAEEVLRIAEEVSADLIVVGLRRRSAVGKLLLGSNAQHIILSANCPVLSVRPAAD